MRFAGAIMSKEASVKAWVIASSSAVYPSSSQSPLMHREDELLDGSAAASFLEAEEYVRDVANRAPHINVSILRLQHLVGKGVRSPLSSVLSQPLVPAAMGYDATVQLLAVKDAVRALTFAAEMELAGVYNVASAGTVRFREAIRTLGRRALPLLPVEAGPFEGIAKSVGIPHVPNGMLGLLRFGHALDTSKISSAGFHPECDQDACLALLG
jgi:nucleoside-diphosphate-sugar epimerase